MQEAGTGRCATVVCAVQVSNSSVQQTAPASGGRDRRGGPAPSAMIRSHASRNGGPATKRAVRQRAGGRGQLQQKHASPDAAPQQGCVSACKAALLDRPSSLLDAQRRRAPAQRGRAKAGASTSELCVVLLDSTSAPIAPAQSPQVSLWQRRLARAQLCARVCAANFQTCRASPCVAHHAAASAARADPSPHCRTTAERASGGCARPAAPGGDGARRAFAHFAEGGKARTICAPWTEHPHHMGVFCSLIKPPRGGARWRASARARALMTRRRGGPGSGFPRCARVTCIYRCVRRRAYVKAACVGKMQSPAPAPVARYSADGGFRLLCAAPAVLGGGRRCERGARIATNLLNCCAPSPLHRANTSTTSSLTTLHVAAASPGRSDRGVACHGSSVSFHGCPRGHARFVRGYSGHRVQRGPEFALRSACPKGPRRAGAGVMAEGTTFVGGAHA